MSPRIFRNPCQSGREGQGIQHHDGLHDVIVNFVALLFRQRSPADAKVMEFAVIEQVLGNIHLEAVPRIMAVNLLTRNAVPGLIHQQLLRCRQDITGGLMGLATLLLLPGQAQAVIEVAHPALGTNLTQSLNLLLIKEFSAEIALGHKRKLLLKRLLTLLKSMVKRIRITSSQQPLQPLNLSITPEHFKPGSDLMDPVTVHLQLGGLVDHVFRGSHLAAVMQPGPGTEFTPGFRAAKPE